jgi:hypothetical protein
MLWAVNHNSTKVKLSLLPHQKTNVCMVMENGVSTSLLV